jgi:hypothetical protein
LKSIQLNGVSRNTEVLRGAGIIEDIKYRGKYMDKIKLSLKVDNKSRGFV